jgi:hypothetical protein
LATAVAAACAWPPLPFTLVRAWARVLATADGFCGEGVQHKHTTMAVMFQVGNK